MSENFIDDFDHLVEHLCQAHAGHCSSRYALYGHSMGGLLAYGMAMRWRSMARRLPEMLFASASPAPRHRDPDYFLSRQTDAALVADLRKQGGTPEEVFQSTEMLRITLDTLHADYRVCSSYRYRDSHPLGVPIHVFAGRQDDIEAERILAWKAETSAQFSVHWYDGGHFFVREHEAAVLNAVTGHLLNGHTEVGHAPAVGT